MGWFDYYRLFELHDGDLDQVPDDVLEMAMRGGLRTMPDDVRVAKQKWATRFDCGHRHRRADLASYDDGPYPPELVVAMQILDYECAHRLPEPLSEPATGRSCARHWGQPCDCGVDDAIESRLQRLGPCAQALIAEARRLQRWRTREADLGSWSAGEDREDVR